MVVAQLFESCADLLRRTVDVIEVHGHECVERTPQLDQPGIGVVDSAHEIADLAPGNAVGLA
jgi:hypothetical protein